MIYLQLFLNFLKIGALSFGGGYGMIAVVKETVISNAWLTETEFLDFVAVAEAPAVAAALDAVLDKLREQLRRYKDKSRAHHATALKHLPESVIKEDAES